MYFLVFYLVYNCYAQTETNVTTSIGPCELLDNSQFLWDEETTWNTTTAEGCCNYCYEQGESCAVWTWNKYTHLCSIKHKEAVKLTKEGFISGRKSSATYIGCFVDNSDRDLPIFQETLGMTPELCADICRGHKYFGLQWYSQCFCGDTYGKYASSTEDDCSTPCSGAPDVMCGGVWRNSIYSLSVQEDLSTWVEFINTDFSNENIVGWTATGLKNDQQLTVAHCGTKSILGGVNILGKGNTLQWHYNSPIVFSKMKIYFEYAFLASWDNEDAWMTINNVEVWRRKSHWSSHINPPPCSGNKYGDGFEEFEVSTDLQSVGDLVITFYNNLDTANTSDESFGLTYFRVLVKPDPFQYKNIALNKEVSQSSTKDGNSPGRANDGNTMETLLMAQLQLLILKLILGGKST